MFLSGRYKLDFFKVVENTGVVCGFQVKIVF